MWIERKDFGENVDRTYRITCPGVYKLHDNISFRPTQNKTTAISIESDSVTLDLNGKILQQSSKSSQTQVTGITVKTGHSNVTILGNYGVVKNFSQRGIYVQGGNKLVTIGNDTLLTVTNCGYGTPVALKDGNENILQAGIQLGDMVFFVKFGFGQYYGLLQQISLVNVVSTINNVGIGLGEGSEYDFQNCSFSNNLERRLINEKIVNLGGFYIPNSVVCYGLVYFSNPELDTADLKSFGITNIEFRNCNFNSNTANGVEIGAAGAYCDSFFIGVNFRGLKVTNSQFNSNVSTLGDNGIFNKTRGCTLSSGYGTVFESCEFSNNLGGAVVNGLNISGLIAADNPLTRNNFQAETTVIKNCVAARNIASVDRQAVDQIEVLGFSIRYPSGLIISDCTIENNIARLTSNSASTITTFADGILIFSDIRYPCKFANNIEVKNCKISRNRVTFGYRGTSSGIRILDDLCENIVIRDNVITENWKSIEDPNNADYSILGSGVDLFNETEEKTGPSYVSVLDNVIKSNNNFGVSTNLDYTNIQSNNIQNHDVGINIGLLSCGNSVLNNTILQSGLAGITDENIPSTSYVANNVVFGTSQGYNVIYPGGVSLNVSSGSIVNPVVFPPVSETSGSNTEVEGVECNNYVEACLLADSFRNVKVRHLDLKSLQDYKRSMKQFHRV